MRAISTQRDPLDEIELVPAHQPDRLPAMLFLAALFHGLLIIGVTFNPYLTDTFASAVSLEVTIVADPDQAIDRPDRAEYLAQASQTGGGNTADEVRPTAPLESASPVDNIGQEDGQALRDATTNEVAADQLINTRNEQQRQVVDDLRETPQPESRVAIALESGSETTLPLPQDENASLLIHDDDPRQLVVSADTSESIVAPYLDRWKRRIETVGNEFFAELDDRSGYVGSPTLEVRIEASGQLAEVVIRQSSGSRVVDQAALDILRRASPFDPFPETVAEDYDRLLFAYKWQFGSVGTVSAREGG